MICNRKIQLIIMKQSYHQVVLLTAREFGQIFSLSVMGNETNKQTTVFISFEHYKYKEEQQAA